jgi:hypothetical protein
MKGYWSDPLWRRLRIASFISAVTVLVLLAVYLLGVQSLLVPLAVFVIVNIVIQSAVGFRTFSIWREHRK